MPHPSKPRHHPFLNAKWCFELLEAATLQKILTLLMAALFLERTGQLGFHHQWWYPILDFIFIHGYFVQEIYTTLSWIFCQRNLHHSFLTSSCFSNKAYGIHPAHYKTAKLLAPDPIPSICIFSMVTLAPSIISCFYKTNVVTCNSFIRITTPGLTSRLSASFDLDSNLAPPY